MCFTTGKMLRMSSSVNTVLGSESKWYSLKRIWRRDEDELAIRVKEMHRHCQKIMLNHVYYKLIYLNASFDGDLSEQGDPLQPAFVHGLLHTSTARKRWDLTRIKSQHSIYLCSENRTLTRTGCNGSTPEPQLWLPPKGQSEWGWTRRSQCRPRTHDSAFSDSCV